MVPDEGTSMGAKKTKEDVRAMATAMAAARGPVEMAAARGRKAIGYWLEKKERQPTIEEVRRRRNPQHEAHGLLWPGDFIDEEWSHAERALVVIYLKQTLESETMGWMGYSECRLCREKAGPRLLGTRLEHWECNGTRDFGDGVYVWPEGYAHYVEIHAVKPPEDFIEHVRARNWKFP